MFSFLAQTVFETGSDPDVGVGQRGTYIAPDGTEHRFNGVFDEPELEVDAGLSVDSALSTTQPMVGLSSSALPDGHPKQGARLFFDVDPTRVFRVEAVEPRELGRWLDVYLVEE